MSITSKLLFATGAVAAGLTATPAFAEGPYVGGFVGTFAPEDFDINEADELSADSGVIFGGVLGTNFSERVRGEVEVSYWSGDADCSGKCGDASFDAAALSVLGNVWFDFGDGEGFTPYVGGGLGMANVSLESESGDSDAWAFAYQAGLGARFGLGGATVDVGYRYRGVSVDLEDHPLIADDVDVAGHGFQVGATFPF